MDLITNNPVVSLIIPVYNVEKYLRLALESAVNQTLKNIEIIVVNDGSTDSGYKIIKEFADVTPNMIVINQENSGLSAAKNAGLRVASGDYIAFMDSDDHVAPDFLEVLYNLAVNNDADISYCNYNVYYPESGRSFYMPFTSRNAVYSKETALNKLILDVTLHHFSWNKLYKRSLFTDNNIDFCPMFFEDIATSPKLFYFANKVAVTNKSLYYYTQRDGSIISSMNVRKINDYNLSYGIIREFLESQNDFRQYKSSFKIYGYRAFLVNIYNIFNIHCKKMNFTGFFKNLKQAFKSLLFFMSDNYAPCNDIPKLPFPVAETPVNKKSAITGE